MLADFKTKCRVHHDLIWLSEPKGHGVKGHKFFVGLGTLLSHDEDQRLTTQQDDGGRDVLDSLSKIRSQVSRSREQANQVRHEPSIPNHNITVQLL